MVPDFREGLVPGREPLEGGNVILEVCLTHAAIRAH